MEGLVTKLVVLRDFKSWAAERPEGGQFHSVYDFSTQGNQLLSFTGLNCLSCL